MSKLNLKQALQLLDEYDSDVSDSYECVENSNDDDTKTVNGEHNNTNEIETSHVSSNCIEETDSQSATISCNNVTCIEEIADNTEDMIRVEIYNADDFPNSFLDDLGGNMYVLDVDDIREVQTDNNNNTTHDKVLDDKYVNSCNTIINSDSPTDKVRIAECSSHTSDECSPLDYSLNKNLANLEKSGNHNVTNIVHEDSITSIDLVANMAVHQPSHVETILGGNMTENTPVLQMEERSRSKVKDVEKWKKTIRKRRRQAGEEYVSARGKQISKKTPKLQKDCKNQCRLNCSVTFDDIEVRRIHSDFWSLDDDQKAIFYAQTTERKPNLGDSNKHERKESRRKFTYQYYFCKDNIKFRACKEFYFGVLSIHESRVRNYYNKLDNPEVTEFRDMRGRNTKSRIPKRDTEFVRDHISSFNRVPSHYCRSNSKKDYLERSLNISKMYTMPLKLSMYRHIFNTQFNISFHVPKKDRCDTCELMRMGTMNIEYKAKFDNHMSDKIDTKTERDSDRQQNDNTVATICFDLENVITLPKADVKNFFYKRKLNVFNLTAHCSIDKGVYNAIWSEAEAGRGSNEIASALVNILRNIRVSHPDVNNYILWSDSCIPQNKNSIMTCALKLFMEEHNIKTITQKFGCPGHSPVQEVDSAHSSIEQVLKVTEVYSPVSLIRTLKSVKRKNPFKILQLRTCNFYNYKKNNKHVKIWFHTLY